MRITLKMVHEKVAGLRRVISNMESMIAAKQSAIDGFTATLNMERMEKARLAADFNSLNRRFIRTTEALFDLTELHLATMKRVKVDQSHPLIDNSRDDHPLFSMDQKTEVRKP